MAGKPAARFRFITKSDNGNNLYLDNINLSDKTVGVSQIADPQQLSIYPNPASGIFQVRSGIKIQGIEIYNMVGEKIYSAQWLNNGVIDISSQPAGVYFLKTRSENGAVTKKIVVQK